MSMIQFESNGTTYTLEFNRKTSMQAEQSFGVSLGEIQAQKMSQLPALFHCAFLMHHPNIKRSVTESFFEQFEDKVNLFVTLAKMYGEGLEELFQEPEEGKAISWKVV